MNKQLLALFSLLFSTTSLFAWSFFGPSAKEVESAFIERWQPVSGPRIEERLDMDSVRAKKTERDGIWQVTYDLIVTTITYPEIPDPEEDARRKVLGKGPSIFKAIDFTKPQKRVERITYKSTYSVRKVDGVLKLKSLAVKQ